MMNILPIVPPHPVMLTEAADLWVFSPQRCKYQGCTGLKTVIRFFTSNICFVRYQNVHIHVNAALTQRHLYTPLSVGARANIVKALQNHSAASAYSLSVVKYITVLTYITSL